jgi:diguanylate cyclase (GGDEF)-like protein
MDERTGFYWSESFPSEVESALAKARELGQDMGLIGMDIDRHAYMNYVFGHHAGTAALGAVATIMRATFGPRDVVRHWRQHIGDYCVLLPDSSLVDLFTTAERLRQAAIVVRFDPHDLVRPITPGNCLSFSIGVASYPEDGDRPALLLDTVEAGIMRAKWGGGDAVCHVANTERVSFLIHTNAATADGHILTQGYAFQNVRLGHQCRIDGGPGVVTVKEITVGGYINGQVTSGGLIAQELSRGESGTILLQPCHHDTPTNGTYLGIAN